MAEISITRALAELKKFEAQIKREMETGRFVGVGFGRTGANKNGETKGKVSGEIESSFDRIKRLFAVRQEIKAAIVKSNAVVVVKVAGSEMSVAEAIELKRSVNFYIVLLSQLKTAKAAAERSIEAENTRLETMIQNQLQTLYGNEKGKVSADMYAQVADPIKAAQEPVLIDPRNIGAEIKRIEEFIESVQTELDFALSESNARTVINVESLA